MRDFIMAHPWMTFILTVLTLIIVENILLGIINTIRCKIAIKQQQKTQ